jgi:ATP-dependent Lhr-like helicase
MDLRAARALVEYLRQQRDATKTPLPHRHHIVIEHCVDYRHGEEHPQIILHTTWGAPMNRPFTFALIEALTERFGGRPEVFCDNDAIVIALHGLSAVPDPFELVTAENIEMLLRRRLEQTGFFGARFRENASRALLLPRDAFGQRMPLWMTRLRSKRLLDAIAEYPDFPILTETWRTCLQDEFALDRLRARLDEVRIGAIRVSRADTSAPSPFTRSLMWQQTNSYMYRDDAPDAPVHSRLRDDVLAEVTHTADLRPQLDPGLAVSFTQKLQRIHPGYAPSTAEELLDWIKERQYVSDAEWASLQFAIERDTGAPAAELVAPIQSKIVRLNGGLAPLDSAQRTIRVFEGAGTMISTEFPAGLPPAPEDVPSLADWLAEWLVFYGPVSAAELQQRLPIPHDQLAEALAELVEAETIVAGHLTRGADTEEFCDAGNFESLLRIARAAARPTTAPLPAAKLSLFLAAWQGLARASGADSDPDRAVESLFGHPIPADLLESDVLPARIAQYNPPMADAWLASGRMLWMGAGPERIALCPREAVQLIWNHARDADADAEVDDLLPAEVGRYTFAELVDHTGLNTAELTRRLWHAAWIGAITTDSFGPLRVGLRTRFRPPRIDAAMTSRRGAFRAWKASRSFEGCWLAVPRPEPPEDALEAAELDNDRARLLLDRFGIVFRELIERELPPLQWSAVFRALRRLELAGEAIAGSFFEGIRGLQFASPPAAQRLTTPLPEDSTFWMNATDSASVCGLGIEGLEPALPPRLKTTRLIYAGARLALALRRSGREWDLHLAPDDPALPQCLEMLAATFAHRSGDPSGMTVDLINGEPANKSENLATLRNFFTVVTDARRMTLYPRVDRSYRSE